jgi:hypothetical protein
MVSADRWLIIDSETNPNSLKEIEHSNVLAMLTNAYPPGMLYGLTLSNNTGDATNDIDIAAGKCRDSADGMNMVLASALTKRLDAAWAVGTNQGGLDTGSIANTTYHVWLIKRSDTGVVDALFSASATAPTMPANYDYKRRIGSIVRAGAAIRAFYQDGDTFYWTAQVTDLNGGAATTGTAVPLTVPTGIKVEALMEAGITAPVGGGAIRIYDPDITSASAPEFYFSFAPSSVFAASWGMCKTNTSGQVKYFVSAGGSGYIYTQGWRDTRGRLS